MFNVEQRASDADESGRSLAPVVISLLNTYAGLSLAVAGLVLDTTALVVGGLILVMSAAVLIRMPGSKRRRKDDPCESLRPSMRLLRPSARNSVSPNGFPSIRNASMRSPTPPATTSGSTSTLSEPALKVLIAQRSRTGS
jgi:hypothetical protein